MHRILAHKKGHEALDQLDMDVLRGSERPQLATCEYIEHREDILIPGPIGTGETLLAIALGIEDVYDRHLLL